MALKLKGLSVSSKSSSRVQDQDAKENNVFPVVGSLKPHPQAKKNRLKKVELVVAGPVEAGSLSIESRTDPTGAIPMSFKTWSIVSRTSALGGSGPVPFEAVVEAGAEVPPAAVAACLMAKAALSASAFSFSRFLRSFSSRI